MVDQDLDVELRALTRRFISIFFSNATWRYERFIIAQPLPSRQRLLFRKPGLPLILFGHESGGHVSE